MSKNESIKNSTYYIKLMTIVIIIMVIRGNIKHNQYLEKTDNLTYMHSLDARNSNKFIYFKTLQKT